MGTVAAQYKDADGKIAGEIGDYSESGHRLAAVAGTSTCHIVQSHQGVFVPGVWGPYKVELYPEMKDPVLTLNRTPYSEAGG